MNVWRLLPFQQYSAFENMAIDEAIFRESQRIDTPPTFRLFGWSPPAVSIGFFQDFLSDIDIEACRKDGVDVVRRTTGGKAVFHDLEITYSLTGREDNPFFPGTLLGRYHVISEAIAAGLSTLGVQAELEKKNTKTSEELREFCFYVPAQHELLVKGKKICGSAQARTNGAFLQHGSLLLDFDPAIAFELMTRDKRHKEEKIKKLSNSITSIHSESSTKTDLHEVCDALVMSFERKFGIKLEPGELTPEEKKLQDKLLNGKYLLDSWNQNGKSSVP
jgi:lipoate-protein ligase A